MDLCLWQMTFYVIASRVSQSNTLPSQEKVSRFLRPAHDPRKPVTVGRSTEMARNSPIKSNQLLILLQLRAINSCLMGNVVVSP